MDTNIELPQGWQKLSLRDVLLELESGKRPKGGVNGIESGIPSVGAEHLDQNGGFKFQKIKYVPEEFARDMKKGILRKDDIVIVKDGATTGKASLVRTNFPYSFAVINEHVFICRLKDAIIPKYAFYHIWSQKGKNQILKDFRGAAQGGISSSFVDYVEFGLPSQAIQHQIVEKIEELFSELDKGIENLKIAQQQLKVYRQAVLKWAFEGKLTNENVKDGELPEGWEWVRLKEVCEKIQDGSHFSPQVQYDEPRENRYMYITAKNIRNNYMDFRKLYYVDKAYHESIYSRCNPEYGDVLLTKDGINTGEVTQNTLKEPFSMLSSVCLFKTKRNMLKPELLKYFIQSPFGNKVIIQSMTGTAIKRIILRKIKDAHISLPPLSEQLGIVQEIESRLSVCDKIEETITNSLQQAEALRQSILKRAFEGKLVAITKKI